MASAVVVVGVPRDLERGEYTSKKGKREGETIQTLSFKLHHPATAMAWPMLCEARDGLIAEVEAAAAEGQQLQFAAVPVAIRKDGEDGPRDWVKLSIRAILPA